MMASAEEIRVDAAVVAIFIRTGWRFHLKRRTKNSAEGFPKWKRLAVKKNQMSPRHPVTLFFNASSRSKLFPCALSQMDT